jgi:hypothetical protein
MDLFGFSARYLDPFGPLHLGLIIAADFGHAGRRLVIHRWRTCHSSRIYNASSGP